MASFAAAVPRQVPILRVAEGGMGYVELVARRDGRFTRLFARKRLHPPLRVQPAFRAMFLDEARLAGLMRHPNATSVVEIGEDEDGPFLLMEYVDGVNLAQVLERLEPIERALPLAFCVSVAAQAARGLHAAHELVGPDGTPLGVVHRDISPKNLLLGYDGWLRVTDFGIAKARGNVEQTMVGVLKGNIGYMAPEYLGFREIDQRSDLFALGVVLYELLTRERLYGGTDTAAIARRILEEPPPDVFETRDVPPELSSLAFDLLAKDRELRPPNALAVATRLDEITASLAAVDGPFDMAAFLEGELGELRSARQAQVDAALARADADAKLSPWARALRRLGPPATVRRAIALGLGLVTAFAAIVGGAWGVQQLRAVTFAPGAASLWSGGEHNCALHAGQLTCWGNNGRGQLGDGTRDDRRAPVRVDIGPVRAVALGDYHSCALESDGRVACWGRNIRGEIGRSAPTFVTRPLDVPGVEHATAIASGRQHACALLDGGRLSCWGANFSGQLGRPPSESGEPPGDVPGLPPVREVFAGGANTCARLVDGELRCWGANESGQLLLADRGPSPTPTPIPGADDFATLGIANNDRAASQNLDRTRIASYMCAVTRAGAVLCWGNNYTAQLGDGSRENRAAPTPVLGVSDALQVVAGDVHACALHRSLAVSCWGRNEFGAIGDGSMGPSTVRTEPVKPIGIDRAVGLALGRAHTCARLRDGAISCWGVNNFGQLGDGTTLLRAEPVITNGFP